MNNLPVCGFFLLGCVGPGDSGFGQESSEREVRTAKDRAATAAKASFNYFCTDLSQQTSASPPFPGSFQSLWFCL